MRILEPGLGSNRPNSKVCSGFPIAKRRKNAVTKNESPSSLAKAFVEVSDSRLVRLFSWQGRTLLNTADRLRSIDLVS